MWGLQGTGRLGCTAASGECGCTAEAAAALLTGSLSQRRVSPAPACIKHYCSQPREHWTVSLPYSIRKCTWSLSQPHRHRWKQACRGHHWQVQRGISRRTSGCPLARSLGLLKVSRRVGSDRHPCWVCFGVIGLAHPSSAATIKKMCVTAEWMPGIKLHEYLVLNCGANLLLFFVTHLGWNIWLLHEILGSFKPSETHAL